MHRYIKYKEKFDKLIKWSVKKIAYKVTIIVREEGKLEAIAFETETDFINEALNEVKQQIRESSTQIPKGIIETIVIQKVK